MYSHDTFISHRGNSVVCCWYYCVCRLSIFVCFTWNMGHIMWTLHKHHFKLSIVDNPGNNFSAPSPVADASSVYRPCPWPWPTFRSAPPPSSVDLDLRVVRCSLIHGRRSAPSIVDASWTSDDRRLRSGGPARSGRYPAAYDPGVWAARWGSGGEAAGAGPVGGLIVTLGAKLNVRKSQPDLSTTTTKNPRIQKLVHIVKKVTI